MSDLQDILREEYEKTMAEIIDPGALMTMIEETLDRTYEEIVVKEAASTGQTTAKEFLLVLPKFVPTEAWGDPESMERAQITRLFNVIGGGRNISGKLTFLQRIASPDNKITSPRRIISSLIILESLSAVVTSFNASSAGFVFEGFLSALLQGTQEAEISAKGNLPIQDLIAFTESDNPVPISLKLLNQTTNIEGSYTNLIDGLDEFGHMVYIVARKDGESISIEKFTFNQENFIDALTLSARGRGKKSGLLLVQLPDMSPEESIATIKSTPTWEERYDLLQQTNGYSERIRQKRADSQAQEEGGLDLDPDTSLEEAIRQEWDLLTESSGGTQWSISPAQLVSFDFVEYETLGELPYSSEQIEKIAELHMDKLNDELTDLFSATQALSENINKYFTFDKRDRAISSGERAIQNTQQIETSLRSQISDDPKEL
jgi:hypothetical protein